MSAHKRMRKETIEQRMSGKKVDKREEREKRKMGE